MALAPRRTPAHTEHRMTGPSGDAAVPKGEKCFVLRFNDDWGYGSVSARSVASGGRTDVWEAPAARKSR
jgi:hypothetical protein